MVEPNTENSRKFDFPSEFIAMKHCIDDTEYLRLKLRMFNIPFAEERPSTYVRCDNENVVNNSSHTYYNLNKKHSEIAFNFTCWNMEAGVFTVAWISTGEKIADEMAKRISDITRDYLFGNWTYKSNHDHCMITILREQIKVVLI